MPSQSFRHSTTVETSPARAWAALQEAETWRRIAGVDEVSAPRRSPGGDLLGFRFAVALAGRRHQGEAVTVASNPPTEMAIEIDTSELAGRIEVLLGDNHYSTTIEVILEARSKTFISGLAFPVVANAIGANLPGKVDAFATELEARAREENR